MSGVADKTKKRHAKYVIRRNNIASYSTKKFPLSNAVTFATSGFNGCRQSTNVNPWPSISSVSSAAPSSNSFQHPHLTINANSAALVPRFLTAGISTFSVPDAFQVSVQFFGQEFLKKLWSRSTYPRDPGRDSAGIGVKNLVHLLGRHREEIA